MNLVIVVVPVWFRWLLKSWPQYCCTVWHRFALIASVNNKLNFDRVEVVSTSCPLTAGYSKRARTNSQPTIVVFFSACNAPSTRLTEQRYSVLFTKRIRDWNLLISCEYCPRMPVVVQGYTTYYQVHSERLTFFDKGLSFAFLFNFVMDEVMDNALGNLQEVGVQMDNKERPFGLDYVDYLVYSFESS